MHIRIIFKEQEMIEFLNGKMHPDAGEIVTHKKSRDRFKVSSLLQLITVERGGAQALLPQKKLHAKEKAKYSSTG